MIDIKKLPRSESDLEYFKSGQIIIRDGETECDKMYILLKGTTYIYKNYQEPGEIKIAELRHGDFFGEMSLFLNIGRTATVVAGEDVTALTIDRASARDFFEKNSEATYSLIQTLCSRLDSTNVSMTNNHVKYEQSINSLNCEKSELQIAANLDPLTSIFNRRCFMDTAVIRVGEALKDNKCAFIALFDLDHFKAVNDTYGHPAGDMVLRRVADTVSRSIRSDDLFGRYGGEEFVLLYTGITKDIAFELVERLRNNLRNEPIEFEGRQLTISASFGIAPVLNDFTASISQADKALYRAKKGGRDRTIFYEDWV